MKKIIALSTILITIFALFGCNNEMPTNSVSETESISATEPVTTKELTMEDIWDSSYLNGFGDLLYPGFTLGYCQYNKGYAKTYTNEESGICITEPIVTPSLGNNKVTISNGEKTVSAILYDNLSEGAEGMCERLLMMDLTGDGTKELIIKLDHAEMNYHMTYLYVFDSVTLEQIPIADGIGDLMSGYFQEAKAENVTEEGFDLVVTDKDGNTVTDHSEENITDAKMEWYVDKEPTNVVIKDGILYLQLFGDYVNIAGNRYRQYAGAYVEQQLEYDASTGSFEAVLPAVLKGDVGAGYIWNTPIYPENYDKAMIKFEMYNQSED